MIIKKEEKFGAGNKLLSTLVRNFSNPLNISDGKRPLVYFFFVIFLGHSTLCRTITTADPGQMSFFLSEFNNLDLFSSEL